MKTEERLLARQLRAQGASVKEIERRLGVARSSVGRWVRDIRLNDEQRAALAARVTEGNFLRDELGVPSDDITMRCQLFADHLERQLEIEDFWLRTCKLPRSSLRKSTVNVQSKSSLGERFNMLPYGTCTVADHSTRIVQTIYGSIQEYGGFERPEWLD